MSTQIAHFTSSQYIELDARPPVFELEGSQPIVELDRYESVPVPIANLGTAIAFFEPTPTPTASEHPPTWFPLDIRTNSPLHSQINSGPDELFGLRLSGPCLERNMEEDLSMFSRTHYSNVDSSLVLDTKNSGFPPFASIGCPICSMEFSGIYQKGNLTRHLRQTHTLPSSIRCRKARCDGTYVRIKARTKHKWEKHTISDSDRRRILAKLKIPMKVLSNSATIVEHIKEHELQPGKLCMGDASEETRVVTHGHQLSAPTASEFTWCLSGIQAPKTNSECMATINLCEISDNILDTQQQDSTCKIHPITDNLAAVTNAEPITMKRSASLPLAPELSPSGAAFTAVFPQRAISAPGVSGHLTDDMMPSALSGALNGVSIFYSAKSEQYIIDTDAENIEQLTKSMEIHQCSTRNPGRTSSLTDLHNAKTLTRTYTLKISPKHLRDLPFANLMRSASLEDADFYKSVQEFYDIRYVMDIKEKKQHRFQAGKISLSSRDTVMRKAYPPLKCDQCPRVFTGQYRRRILAGHRKRAHRRAPSISEDVVSPQTLHCQRSRSHLRRRSTSRSSAYTTCSRLNSRNTIKKSKSDTRRRVNLRHRNSTLGETLFEICNYDV
ncbi:hypothetical protein K505DRAFT_359909 [Melanomma pulvis-pyrius CBS 109.77]|uniref:C2H2-type domain-containing protein n=1 Tax=Melanomma pulvis-pyrius CBS 109.77 TaxID=1314802 RepID=A0A6A6XH93_9PLEO|nr:hypothetical protein K505DRAFT_359909 [Melanomma pulvis-pyrius CBS 109.77]